MTLHRGVYFISSRCVSSGGGVALIMIGLKPPPPPPIRPSTAQPPFFVRLPKGRISRVTFKWVQGICEHFFFVCLFLSLSFFASNCWLLQVVVLTLIVAFAQSERMLFGILIFCFCLFFCTRECLHTAEDHMEVEEIPTRFRVWLPRLGMFAGNSYVCVCGLYWITRTPAVYDFLALWWSII